MPSIGDYNEWIRVAIGEGGKILILLLLVVFCIRLWKRMTGARRTVRGVLVACALTAATIAAGYWGTCHSLSRLYSFYGDDAFNESRCGSAVLLYQTSNQYWRRADTVGKLGVSLLLLGQPTPAQRLLTEAKSMRGGVASHQECFFQGLYWFLNDRPAVAVSLLERSRGDVQFQWKSVKLLSIIAIDQGRISEVVGLMEPFRRAKVEEGDHAYIQACLLVHEGRKNAAWQMIQPYVPDQFPKFLLPRVERLRNSLPAANHQTMTAQ